MRLQYKRDGDKWCCFDASTFTNLQESPAGFGDTQEEARQNLLLSMEQHRPTDQGTSG